MRHAASLSAFLLLLSACSASAVGPVDVGSSSGGSTGGRSSGGGSSAGQNGGSSSGASSGNGASSSSSSSSSGGTMTGGATLPSDDAGAPASGGDSGESPPTRNGSCTPLSQQNGSAVNTDHGRLDGTLVYVLPVDGSGACNGDSAHVHLQIEVSGSVYDVAVDIGKSGDEVGWSMQTMAVPGGAWSEGWHGTDALGYDSLGLSASQFATLDPTAMGGEVETLLANTSQISIFCTGYSQGNGCHDVHYENGSSTDGAIVLDPMSATSPVVFFRFQN